MSTVPVDGTGVGALFVFFCFGSGLVCCMLQACPSCFVSLSLCGPVCSCGSEVRRTWGFFAGASLFFSFPTVSPSMPVEVGLRWDGGGTTLLALFRYRQAFLVSSVLPVAFFFCRFEARSCFRFPTPAFLNPPPLPPPPRNPCGGHTFPPATHIMSLQRFFFPH